MIVTLWFLDNNIIINGSNGIKIPSIETTFLNLPRCYLVAYVMVMESVNALFNSWVDWARCLCLLDG